MGFETVFVGKLDLACSEAGSSIYNETALWEGYGHEIAPYLTDYELRRWVEEPVELLEEFQGLLSREKLGS